MTQAFNLSQLANNLNTAGQLDATDGLTGAVPIANGGTGQTTATNAINALLPSQSGNNGRFLSTNGTNTSWVASASRNGGTTIDSATDITLTSSSDQVQYVGMTTEDKFVILPNATTLSEGDTVFTIINSGQYSFGIKDGSGNIIYTGLSAFNSVTLALINNSATQGQWLVVINNDIVALLSEQSVSASTISQTITSFCLLSSTSFVCTYTTLVNSGTYDIFAVAGTISGTTATFGTPVLVQRLSAESIGMNTYPRLAKTSSTTAIIAWAFVLENGGNPTGTARACSISVSGTTVSAGSVNTFSSVSGYGTAYLDILSLNGTSAVIYFNGFNSGGYIQSVRVGTSSGTTLTLGSANSVGNATSIIYDSGSIRGVIASDKFFWGSATGNEFYIFSVSGTTITRGTNYSAVLADIKNTQNLPIIISSTQFLQRKVLVTYSGTTVSSMSLLNSNSLPIGTGEQTRISNSLYTPTEKQNISGTVVFPAGIVGSTGVSSIVNFQVLNSTTLIGGCMSSSGFLSILFVKVL